MWSTFLPVLLTATFTVCDTFLQPSAGFLLHGWTVSWSIEFLYVYVLLDDSVSVEFGR